MPKREKPVVKPSAQSVICIVDTDEGPALTAIEMGIRLGSELRKEIDGLHPPKELLKCTPLFVVQTKDAPDQLKKASEKRKIPIRKPKAA
jgi:hypothetical protein